MFTGFNPTGLVALGARMKPVSLHQHYRVLRTFFNWMVETGLLVESPMRGIKMKTPRTLPRVPDDEAVRTLLALRAETFEECRNRALVALLVDSGRPGRGSDGHQFLGHHRVGRSAGGRFFELIPLPVGEWAAGAAVTPETEDSEEISLFDPWW